MLVLLGAPHDVAALSGELTVSGQTLDSNGDEADNTVVIPVPAALPVTVEPRRFRLSLQGFSDTGVSTDEDAPGLVILDNTADQSARSSISVMEENITVGALSVTVSIAHKYYKGTWWLR